MANPLSLPHRIPVSQDVSLWWQGLPPLARAALRRSWHPRAELVPFTRKAGAWRRLPIELFAEPADADAEDAEDDALAFSHLYDYVIGNPDIQFFLERRHFHVRRAHAVARDVIRLGVLRADFKCPVADKGCPLQAMSTHASGAALRFCARPSVTGPFRRIEDSAPVTT